VTTLATRTRKTSTGKSSSRKASTSKSQGKKASGTKAPLKGASSRRTVTRRTGSAGTTRRVSAPRTAGDAAPPGADEKRHARTINRRLAKVYPDARCSLDFSSPLELLLATILSAQCTDERVNQVTREFFRLYPTAEHVARASQEEIEEQIRSTGFYRNKTRSIRGAAMRIVEEYGGRVPDTMEDLLSLPGVARKTANVVLGNAFGQASGVVVDTHVQRLTGRLGLTEERDPVKIERDMMALLPAKEWVHFSHRVILHGRNVCLARKPRCTECSLSDLCPSADR
jgi:endonuclease-3